MIGVSTQPRFGRPIESKNLVTIYGTWDFKWPVGHSISISYQELLGDESHKTLLYAIDKFEKAIASWRDPGANISWKRNDAELLPAPSAGQARSIVGKAQKAFDYDVLVSFAALPLCIERTENKPQLVKVNTQTSELGSYATRVDYGVPTLFLGPSGVAPGEKLETWFDSGDFRAAAVHEFGHTLGIPHAHQNPNYRALGQIQLQDRDAIQRILEHHPRYQRFPRADIEPEIRAQWPSVESNGKVQFSDWLDGQALANGQLEKITCMAHPGWSRFLKQTAANDQGAIQPDAEEPELDMATSLDRLLLRTMYKKT